MINTDELLAYQDVAEQQKVTVRARPMIRVGNELSAEQAIAAAGAGRQQPIARGLSGHGSAGYRTGLGVTSGTRVPNLHRDQGRSTANPISSPVAA
jgi:hypothetical protein